MEWLAIRATRTEGVTLDFSFFDAFWEDQVQKRKPKLQGLISFLSSRDQTFLLLINPTTTTSLGCWHRFFFPEIMSGVTPWLYMENSNSVYRQHSISVYCHLKSKRKKVFLIIHNKLFSWCWLVLCKTNERNNKAGCSQKKQEDFRAGWLIWMCSHLGRKKRGLCKTFCSRH